MTFESKKLIAIINDDPIISRMLSKAIATISREDPLTFSSVESAISSLSKYSGLKVVGILDLILNENKPLSVGELRNLKKIGFELIIVVTNSSPTLFAEHAKELSIPIENFHQTPINANEWRQFTKEFEKNYLPRFFSAVTT